MTEGSTYSTIDGEQCQVIATKTNVTTPSGNYLCYLYKFTREKLYQAEIYIAPGVGIVKMVQESFMLKTKITLELKESSKEKREIVFFPIKTGYSWTYVVDLTGKEEVVYKFDSEREFNGVKYYKMKDYFSPFAENKFYLSSSDNGIYVINKDEIALEYNPPALLFKYPANIGDTYSSYEGSECELVSVNAEITVSAGTYSCYKYAIMKDSGFEAELYIAPGVGLVYMLQWREIGGYNVPITFELKDKSF